MPTDRKPQVTTLLWIIFVAGLLGLLYAPLLAWLGRRTLQVSQLANGALLVVLALFACVQDALRSLRFEPRTSNLGLIFVGIAFGLLWLPGRVAPWALPLVLLSFCFACAGVVSFLFGGLAVRQFLPALVAFLVFGLLVGLFPALDWPLRATAARHAGSLLAWFSVHTQLAVTAGRPAELLLTLGGHTFQVATECSGFGLLTSALLLATILAFRLHLTILEKLGLLLLALPIAITCNFLRIVSIALVATHSRLPYGFAHEAIGLVWYFAGLGLIWHLAQRQVSHGAKPA
jgi:exosortase/archaeosortase family protein